MTDPDAIETNVRAVVAATGIEHEFVDCDPDLADTGAFCEAYGYAPEDSANTILVASKGDDPTVVACVVLATHRLDVNKTVRKRMGVRKASFAPADLTVERTGMMIGGVTPFGLPNDLEIWIDQRVVERDRIILGGGSRSAKLYGPPALLTSLPNATVVEGLALDPPE
ncbi:MAG: hypothetical protein GY713_03070 [Actinomycetia bacterium]|nr:hypothetical protein [Actinomycetes bacterium]